ncbi:MAG: type II toxin-antitoxin system mRNA interferase toxin, RelE/StbE family [Candidatus Aminicenantes bacterium]|nr:type II toxin-antitoxin system mRNA interferase toxin, RelE/StbE family [Candidatus Aminicenantes bacterium]
MIKLTWNKSFERKLKRYIKKHPDKENKIKEKLRIFTGEPYAPELRNHRLSGKLSELRAIVIEYDCRIVFKFVDDSTALLINVGTHEEVY